MNTRSLVSAEKSRHGPSILWLKQPGLNTVSSSDETTAEASWSRCIADWSKGRAPCFWFGSNRIQQSWWPPPVVQASVLHEKASGSLRYQSEKRIWLLNIIEVLTENRGLEKTWIEIASLDSFPPNAAPGHWLSKDDLSGAGQSGSKPSSNTPESCLHRSAPVAKTYTKKMLEESWKKS